MAKKRAKQKTRSKKKSKSGIIIGIIIILIFVAAAFLLFKGKKSYSQDSVDTFAKCLTDKGTVMYGAFWCPHCAKTKRMFGSSFRYIHYVECDPRGDNEQSELCIQKSIDKYDTWEFSDGSRIVSEPTFEQLSEKSGCSAPEANSG